MQHASVFGRGTALKTLSQCEGYEVAGVGNVSYLQSSATYDEENGTLTVFALNRNLEESIDVTLDAQSFGLAAEDFIQYTCDDLDKGNTCEDPNAVLPGKAKALPVEENGKWKVCLPKASWNVLRFRVK